MEKIKTLCIRSIINPVNEKSNLATKGEVYYYARNENGLFVLSVNKTDKPYLFITPDQYFSHFIALDENDDELNYETFEFILRKLFDDSIDFIAIESPVTNAKFIIIQIGDLNSLIITVQVYNNNQTIVTYPDGTSERYGTMECALRWIQNYIAKTNH